MKNSDVEVKRKPNKPCPPQLALWSGGFVTAIETLTKRDIYGLEGSRDVVVVSERTRMR